MVAGMNEVETYNQSYARFIDELDEQTMSETEKQLRRDVEFLSDMAAFEGEQDELSREAEFYNSMMTFEREADSRALEREMRNDRNVVEWVDALVM